MAEKKEMQTEVNDKIGNIKAISELSSSLEKIQTSRRYRIPYRGRTCRSLLPRCSRC